MNTAEFVNIAASICPDRIAVVCGEKRYTFSEMEERVNRLSNSLLEMGIEKGERVAIVQVNCNRYVEAYYAAAKLGAIFVPLNCRARQDELKYMINTAEVTTLFIGGRYVGLLNSMRSVLPTVKRFISLESKQEGMLDYEELVSSSSLEAAEIEVQDDEPAMLMFTAGTTGLPKAVMLSHNSFSVYVLGNVEPPDPESEEVNLIAIPLYHIAGAQTMMASTYGGRTMVLPQQFDATEWLALVEKERVTRSVLVPTMLKRIIDHPDFAKCDLSSLQVITYGAASMPLKVIEKAIGLMKDVKFINAFGQTETASTVTTLAPEDHIIEGTEEERQQKLRRLSSIGRAMDDTEVKVMDEAGSELPPGQVGEIVARGPRLMMGYWKAPEATARALDKDGWLHTGDMGWMDEDGYFYLAGRAKDMIIRGGENISPEEVEAVLCSHPCIEDAAVIGVPDEEWGECVRAVVVLKKGQKTAEEELIEFCRVRLASFKKPESVVFVDRLPYSPLGKVLKRVIRERYGKSSPGS
ncbi:MAG: hypothetical protein A2Y60_04310 [Chloroflexi bacterium RBG_13_54_9]|nr:MAG: hypothetical protein A2Y60_04310 [Chloroflexi bacterium RBG_13_54_9]